MTKSDYKIFMISINNVWRYGNIGLDQLVGYLRLRGFNVEIKYFRNKDTAEFIYDNIEKKYNFYGFSVTSANYAKCCEIAERIKNANSRAVIDFGGGYVTRYFREIFAERNVLDFITLGDGEEPTEFLLNKLIANGGYKSALKTENVSVVSRSDTDNKIPHLNGKIDFMPAFDYYETDTPKRNSRKVHCIQIKNNVCCGNCSFCTERHGKPVFKDLDFIAEQIQIVHKRYGVKKIFFTDDNILDPNTSQAKQNLKNLCLKLKSLNLRLAYQCYIKATSLRDVPEDYELLLLMKEVGFVEIFIGLESGNDKDLILYNKHTTVKDNYNIMQMIYKCGLIPIIGFIGFNPYSTLEQITQNFKFLCDVNCTYLFNYLYSFVVLNKYTELYEKVKKDNLILSDEGKYEDIQYDFKYKDAKKILTYIKTEMLPKLKNLDYELDWVTYSYKEHKIWFDSVNDYGDVLKTYKTEDLAVIKKYLSILFVEHNLEKFKTVENEFWHHFRCREIQLKNIYRYLISFY